MHALFVAWLHSHINVYRFTAKLNWAKILVTIPSLVISLQYKYRDMKNSCAPLQGTGLSNKFVLLLFMITVYFKRSDYKQMFKHPLRDALSTNRNSETVWGIYEYIFIGFTHDGELCLSSWNGCVPLKGGIHLVITLNINDNNISLGKR